MADLGRGRRGLEAGSAMNARVFRRRATRRTAFLHPSLLLSLAVTLPGRPEPVRAQAGESASAHAFTIEAGRLWHGVDDDLASTTQYVGDAGVAGVGYRYGSGGWRMGLAAGLAKPRLTPIHSGRRSSHEEASWVTADAWMLRRIWRSERGRWTAFVGPAVAMDVGLRRHFYRLDQSITFDNGFLGLEAAAQIERAVGEGGRVSERVMVPVAGVAVRTAYNTGLGGAGPDVSVGLPPSFLLLRHRFEYRTPVNERLQAGLHYEGTLVRHGRPLDLAVAWHRLGVGVELAWGRP